MRPHAYLPPCPRSVRGFGLLELVISMGLGLLITAALLMIYLRASQSSQELENANRQMENGRYAIQLLKEELWQAGFWGEYVVPTTGAPVGLVDHCTPWASWTAQNKADVYYLPVQGYNNSGPTCATNQKANTDALVVRHASTCVAGVGGCQAFSDDKLYLQVSRCSTQVSPNDHLLGREDDPLVFSMQKKDCLNTNLADKRKYLSYLFYIRPWAKVENDGIPTLMRSEFDEENDVVSAQGAEPLVEGIENLQIEYARDTNGDGEPDTTYATTLASAAEWSQVVAVKISVLARNIELTAGHDDNKTYYLGATSVGPFHDKYKRHVFTTVVKLINPAGRK